MSTTPDHRLGDRIRDLRTERGWSQEQVARSLEVGVLSVGKWERGQANPSIENRTKLATLFQVEPSELGIDTYAGTATPPAWFVNAQLEQMKELREIRELLEVLVNR